MLDQILDEDRNCKFALILCKYGDIESCIDRLLTKFEVHEYFSREQFSLKKLEVPSWSRNRDFSVHDEKIRISSIGELDDPQVMYFCNLDDIWSSLVRELSMNLQCRAMIVRSSELSEIGNNFIQKFELIDAGETSRIVMSSFDEKWRFFQSGLPLYYENMDRYTLRRIRDRLDRKYIIELLRMHLVDLAHSPSSVRNTQWNRHEIATARI